MNWQNSTSEVLFSLEGRSFTLRELKKCVLAACGSVITPYYLHYDQLPLWEVIEAIELVGDLNKANDNGSQDEVGDWLEAMVAKKKGRDG